MTKRERSDPSEASTPPSNMTAEELLNEWYDNIDNDEEHNAPLTVIDFDKLVVILQAFGERKSREAILECAKIAENYGGIASGCPECGNNSQHDIADVIRALANEGGEWRKEEGK